MTDLLKNIDVVQVLSLGAIGLGFFLAILAYRLLAQEQRIKEPRANILKATYVYMGFALFLVVLGIFGRFLDRHSIYTPNSQDISLLSDAFGKKRAEFAGDRKPDQFKQGILKSTQSASFDVDLSPGECKTVLAMVLPTNNLDMSKAIDGPGKEKVSIKSSSGLNFQTGELCAGPSAATVKLTLSTTDGDTPFIVETYFSSRQIFGQDGKATDTAIVAAEMLTLVRPKGYETNQKYFVHVFSDANNRGDAARALAILQDNGFSVRPHIEEGANMAGWGQKGNGIVAGDGEGTQERALEIRRQLKGVIPDAKLQIYVNDENHDLASMGGKTLAVFLSGK